MKTVKKLELGSYNTVSNYLKLIEHLQQDTSYISKSAMEALFVNNRRNREIYEGGACVYYNKGFHDGLASGFEKPLGNEMGKLLFELLNKIGIGFVYKIGPDRYGLEARDLLLEDPYYSYINERKIDTVHFTKYREILIKRIIDDIDQYMIQTGMK